MKTTKKSQCERLLAYLKRHKKGITVLEAFTELGICCLHKRIAELEVVHASLGGGVTVPLVRHRITRTWTTLPSGARVIRYSLAK